MEIKEAVSTLTAKMEEFKTQVGAEARAQVVSIQAEIKSLVEVQVKALQDDVIKKDGTIAQVLEEIKELKAKRGRPGSAGTERRASVMSVMGDMIAEKKDRFIEIADKGGRLDGVMEIKAPGVVTSGSLANGTYIDYLDWRPGMEPTGQTRIRELVRTIASAFDNVQFPVANNPVGQGSFGRQAAETNQKAQVDRGYTMVPLLLTPMAGWITVSRQSLRNIPFLQTWLPTSLNEQLLDTEDLDFSGTLVNAATGSAVTATPGNTPVTVAVERMIYFIKNLGVKKYRATGIACDPGVWAEILTTKPLDYSVPNCVTVGLDGQVRVLGVPLYPVNWLTGGRIIVGDWTKAAIVESEGLNFRQSDNVASQFTANEITFLLERTNGFATFRTDAFITTTLS